MHRNLDGLCFPDYASLLYKPNFSAKLKVYAYYDGLLSLKVMH